jgi:peptidoglycan/LPS O-acetylase OafA/YrhL
VVHFYWISPGRLLAFLFLSGNWYVAAAGTGTSPIAPLWSISLEEQFYLAWPWVAKIGGRTSILGLSVLLIPISWLTLFFLAHGGAHSERAIWVNSLVQFQFFALGALLALGLNGRVPKLSTRVRIGILMAGAIAWLTAQAAFGVRTPGPRPDAVSLILGYTLVAIGCALFLIGFLGAPRQLLPKPLVYLGKISYGLYVFHMLAIGCASKALGLIERMTFGPVNRGFGPTLRSVLMLPVALALTILLAIASYRFLEQRFLKVKERFTLVRSRRA